MSHFAAGWACVQLFIGAFAALYKAWDFAAFNAFVSVALLVAGAWLGLSL